MTEMCENAPSSSVPIRDHGAMPTLNVPSALGPLTLEEQDGAIVRWVAGQARDRVAAAHNGGVTALFWTRDGLLSGLALPNAALRRLNKHVGERIGGHATRMALACGAGAALGSGNLQHLFCEIMASAAASP